jgi:hypothetical protein
MNIEKSTACDQCQKSITSECDHEEIEYTDDTREDLCSRCYEMRQEAGMNYQEHYSL